MRNYKKVISVTLAAMSPLAIVAPTAMPVFAANERTVAATDVMDFDTFLGELPEGVTWEKDIYPDWHYVSAWGAGASIWPSEESSLKWTQSVDGTDKYGNSCVTRSAVSGEYTFVEKTAKNQLENTQIIVRSILNTEDSTSVDTQHEVKPIVYFGDNGSTTLKDTTYESYMSLLGSYLVEDPIKDQVIGEADDPTIDARTIVTYNSGIKKLVDVRVNDDNPGDQLITVTITKPASDGSDDVMVACQHHAVTGAKIVDEETIDMEVEKVLKVWAQYLPENVNEIKIGKDVDSKSYDVSPTTYPRDERVNGIGEYDREGMEKIAMVLKDMIVSAQTATNVTDLEARISAGEKNLDAILKDGELSDEEKEALKQAKLDAIAAIVDSYNIDDFREAERKEINTIVKNASVAIDSAQTPEECERIAEDAISKIDAVKTNDELTAEEEAALADAKEQAKAEINEYIPWDDFTTESETDTLQAAYEEACDEIDQAKTEDAIAETVEDMKSYIDQIVEQLKQDAADEALTKAKEDALAEMKEYLEGKTYKSEQQKEIDQIVADYTAKVNEAKDSASIDSLVKEYKEKVDEIKTSDQIDEEQKTLATQKEEAKKEIRKAVEGKEYRETQAKEVEALLEEYDKKIDDATSKEELDAIVTEAIQKLSAVKTDAQLRAEGNTDPTGKEDGTAGSVQTGDVAPIAGLGIATVLSAIGGYFFKKRK